MWGSRLGAGRQSSGPAPPPNVGHAVISPLKNGDGNLSFTVQPGITPQLGWRCLEGRNQISSHLQMLRVYFELAAQSPMKVSVMSAPLTTVDPVPGICWGSGETY